RPQVGAPFEQVRGERMTDHVRAERARQVGAAAVSLEELPEADAAHGLAPDVQKQPRRGAPFEERGPRRLQVALDPFDRLVPGRDQPFLVTFTDAGQIALLKMQLRRPYADELGDPH